MNEWIYSPVYFFEWSKMEYATFRLFKQTGVSFLYRAKRTKYGITKSFRNAPGTTVVHDIVENLKEFLAIAETHEGCRA